MQRTNQQIEALLLSLQFIVEHAKTLQEQLRFNGEMEQGSLNGLYGAALSVAQGEGDSGESCGGIVCGCWRLQGRVTRNCERCDGDGIVPMRWIRERAMGEKPEPARVILRRLIVTFITRTDAQLTADMEELARIFESSKDRSRFPDTILEKMATALGIGK